VGHRLARLRVQVGQAVVDGVDHLVGVQRGVQRGIDVLGRVTHEGAEIDEITPRRALRCFLSVGAIPAAVVIIAATCSSDERQPEEEGKEL